MGQPIRFVVCLATLTIALTWGATARAGYISATVGLDQSNSYDDGVLYGSVLIEANNGPGPDGGLASGQVKITFTANLLPEYNWSAVTLNRVSFNTDLKAADLDKSQILGPSGWILKSDQQVSEFGKFSWEDKYPNGTDDGLNPVTLLISDLGSNATLDHFLVGYKSKQGDVGDTLFAARVTGTPNEGSEYDQHFIGGSEASYGETIENPEPTTVVLAGLSLAGLGLNRLLRRRRRM